MNEQTVVHPYSGVLFGNIKGWTTQENMAGCLKQQPDQLVLPALGSLSPNHCPSPNLGSALRKDHQWAQSLSHFIQSWIQNLWWSLLSPNLKVSIKQPAESFRLLRDQEGCIHFLRLPQLKTIETILFLSSTGSLKCEITMLAGPCFFWRL